MPYADPAEKAEYDRILFLRRYQGDPEFREEEAFRKKRWYDRNKVKILAAYRAKRKKIRAQRRALEKGQPIHCADEAFVPIAQKVPPLF